MHTLYDLKKEIGKKEQIKKKEGNAVARIRSSCVSTPPDVCHSCRQSEISAKLEPAHPGEALTQLLKGELGAVYELAIDVLWEGTEGERAPQHTHTGLGRVS